MQIKRVSCDYVESANLDLWLIGALTSNDLEVLSSVSLCPNVGFRRVSQDHGKGIRLQS